MVEAVPDIRLPLKIVEVCMGGKCKNSGCFVLLVEFQEVTTGMERSVVDCKFMGEVSRWFKRQT